MDPTPEQDLRAGVAHSVLMRKYGQAIDRDSAYEILARRMEEGAKLAEEEAQREEAEKQRLEAEKQAEREQRRRTTNSGSTNNRRKDDSLIGQIGKSAVFRDIVRTASREIVRGVFGTGRRR